MVVGGQVLNTPSDGSERVIGSHLGIMINDAFDARCELTNGSWCDGTVYKVCEGGIYAEGDCGWYGLSCEEDGEIAFCVDPRCTAGSQDSYCLDGTRIAGCTDGVYSEADCGAYGLSCVSGFGDAWCAASFYQGQPVATSWGEAPLSVRVGQEGRAWVDIQNTGLDAWEPGAVFLAPLPRDAASPYASDGWVSEARVATVAASTAPGQVARFEFPVRAVSQGEGQLSLGLVAEGITWFADAPGGGGPEDGAIVLTVRGVDGQQEDADGSDGCGCAAPARADGWLALLVGAGLSLRRRRAA
jgi:hypothetical protein